MGKFNKTRQEFKEIIWHYFRQPREKGPNEDGRRSASLRFELQLESFLFGTAHLLAGRPSVRQARRKSLVNDQHARGDAPNKNCCCRWPLDQEPPARTSDSASFGGGSFEQERHACSEEKKKIKLPPHIEMTKKKIGKNRIGDACVVVFWVFFFVARVARAT